MKHLLTLILLIASCTVTAQIIHGALYADLRKIDSPEKLIFNDQITAELVYQIGVNNDGKVVYAVIDWNRSTKISIPAEVRAMKYLKSIQFEKGTWFPKIHYGDIRIKLQIPPIETKED